MRSYSLLVACAAALLGVVLWTWFGAPPKSSHERASQAVQPSDFVAGPVPLERAVDTTLVEQAELDGGEGLRVRELGTPIPADVTQLLAVRGSVLDGDTAKPVSGIALSLLSPRPRTSVVATNDDGRFRTGLELAPGVVSVVHVPDPADVRYAARWRIEPDRFVLPPADAGIVPPPHEVVFSAHAPERILEASIRMPGGGLAAGAAVSLARGQRDQRGHFVTESRAFETADELGRVRFPLFGDDAFAASVQIEAELFGGLTSELTTLDPPLVLRPVRIDLFPGGVVSVRTRNDLLRPLAGVSVWIGTREADGTERGRAADTDGRGEVVFTGLRSACYEVRTVHPLTGERVVREVELARGAHQSVDIGLTLAHVRFAAGGVVVDELGYPLPGIAVEVSVPGEAPIELETGPAGRFEFWTKPCARVVVSAGTGLGDDAYEPSELALPFGSDGVRLRRVRTYERQSRAFSLLDAASGAAIERARIALFVGAPGASERGVAITSARGGAAQLDLVLRPDVRYAVDAPGYLRVEGELAALIEAHGKGRVLELALEAGFERSVTVRDRVGRRALAGAAFHDGARGLGVSGENGVVVLRAASWPAAVRVEAPGYTTQTWDPAAAPFPGDVIWLEPL
ncbi:MAG: hypothetical protein ACKVWV_09195 [Planctomycetota bacterium]